MSWKTVSLGEIFDIARGGSPRPIESFLTKDENGVNWIMISDTKNGGKYIEKTAKKIIQEGVSSSRMVNEGDFLLTNSMSFGRPYILKTSGCIHDGWLVLSPKTENINRDYFYYYIGSDEIKQKLSSKAAGAVVKNLNKEIVSDLVIDVPPLETQKRIANILDAADALRQKDQELLKKYDDLAQAIFIDMFGDPVKNEKGWEKVKMENLMKIVRGGSPRPIDKFLGGTYPWIKIGDATKGDDVYLNKTKEYIIEEGLTKTRLLPSGSLIFANCGVSLGFARIITFEGCIHDGWLAFSDFDFSKINKIYLLKALNSITEYFRSSAPEGTQPNLNTNIIKNFELILPPVQLQNRFEEILKSFNLVKVNVEKNSNHSNIFFNSLLQKAFNGEIVS